MKFQIATILMLLASTAYAQTPAQIEYERQQREYRQQMERQQEQQRQQQRTMEENARRQQEESNRLNRPSPQPNYSTPAPTPTAPNYGSTPRPSPQASPRPQSAISPVSAAKPIGPLAPKPWIWTGTFKETDFYADPTSIKRTGNTLRMTDLRNFNAYSTTNSSYISSKLVAEYDCENQRLRMLSYTSHPQLHGQGAPVNSGSGSYSWETPSGSAGGNAGLLKIACR
jgi:hypothetical protein